MPKTTKASPAATAAPDTPPIIPDEQRVYIEYMPLTELLRRYHPQNSKDHDLGAINASYDEFGFVETAVLDECSGLFGAGHGRIETLVWRKQHGQAPPRRVVAGEDGEWYLPVTRGIAFESPAHLEAYLIASNRTTILGGWKEPELLASLTRLQESHPALFEATGFDTEDVRGLMLAVGGDGSGAGAGGDGGDPGALMNKAEELNQRWQVQRGDLWVIPGSHGVHRLLCGDATDESDVARLMGSARAICMWTDPPYGVEYVGGTSDALTIDNDGAEGLDGLLEGAFRAADQWALSEGAAIYVAHPAGALSVTFGTRFLAAGWRLHETLVWVKNRMIMGRSDYHYRHEPILFGYKSGGGRRGRFGGEGWYGGDDQTSVLEYDAPTVSDLHPTMKPVDLIVHCLKNSTIPGDLVYDGFGGSGSTMVACESIGRQGRLLELAPEYCAVVLQRLADLGLTPERAEAET